jgi:hypothetical protein
MLSSTSACWPVVDSTTASALAATCSWSPKPSSSDGSGGGGGVVVGPAAGTGEVRTGEAEALHLQDVETSAFQHGPEGVAGVAGGSGMTSVVE